MTPAEQHLLSAVFEERIDTLIRWRQWWRQPAQRMFKEFEAEHRIELRALLRLRSQVKRAQRRLDYHASFAHDLGQAVMEEDMENGPMPREGLPEFNGSFADLRRADLEDEIELGLI